MAHARHHHHGSHQTLTSQQARRLLGVVVGVVALVALVGMFVLRPQSERPELAEELGLNAEIVDATVTGVPTASSAPRWPMVVAADGWVPAAYEPRRWARPIGSQSLLTAQ